MKYKGLLLEETSGGSEYMVVGLNFSFNKLRFLIRKADMSIPTACKKKPITKICDRAFQRSFITSVDIPDTIASIGDEAFGDCSSIKRLTIGNGVKTIGAGAFKGCFGLLEITLPSSVEKVGENAFKECAKISTFTIGKGVSAISETAFCGCTNLKQFVVDSANPNYKAEDGNLYSKDGKVFVAYAKGKEESSFTVPNGVKYIERFAFEGCDNLKSITLPDSVVRVGADAFKGTVLTYSEAGNLRYLGNQANPYMYLAGVVSPVGVAIPHEKCKIIGYKAFDGSTALNTVKLSNNIVSIGDKAFKGCSGLKEITIPDYVKYVGEDAFGDCVSATKLYVGEDVEEIGSKAFAGCCNISEVELPEKLKLIGEGIFSACSEIKKMTIPFVGNRAGVTEKDNNQYPFGYYFGTASYTGGESTPQYNILDAASDKSEAVDYYLPEKLNDVKVKGGNILSGAFNCCKRLMWIEIQEGVKKIGKNAFSCCSELIEFKIPYSTTVIESSSFYGCNQLTHIEIPKRVKEIGEDAFRDCRRLHTVVLGDELKVIGTNAFRGCYKLVEVHNCSKINLNIHSVDNGCVTYYARCVTDGYSFTSNVRPDAQGFIYYMQRSYYGDPRRQYNKILIDYEGSDSVIQIPDDVVEINRYAFEGNTQITSLNLPRSLTSIGESAFCGCSSLHMVYIPNTVNEIGNSAFNKCSSLSSVFMAGGTSIGRFAFGYCNNLTDLTISSFAKSIGNGAFSHCKKLTFVSIPDSVEYIGTGVFSGCNKITNISMSSFGRGYWYITKYAGDQEKKRDGLYIDTRNSAVNAQSFKKNYKDFFWYKA